MRIIEDIKDLSGPEKAAALMLSLNEQQVGKIFDLMHEDEIREISMTMATLGSLKASVVERMIFELVEQFSSAGSLVGNYESTERLLKKILDPKRADGIMDEIRGPAGRTLWDKLGNVSEEVLASYLKNEYPQTVAVVLSKIRSDHTAKVLTQLPENFAMEVVMRMLKMESVPKDVLFDVERTLRSEFMSNLSRTQRRDPHEVIAEIFNNLDRNTELKFIGALEERNKDAAEKIKAMMFTFEDLIRIDAAGMQTILRVIDKSKLARALKGASDGLKNLFFSNMSERASKLLKEDMESLGPIRLKEVDEAQMYIVQTAKDLAAKEEIIITDNKSEEDQLVY